MNELAKKILDKFVIKVVGKEAVYSTMEEGKWGVDQHKAIDYTGDNYSENFVLMYTPFNCLRIEFEDTPDLNRRYISVVEATAKAIGYDYCVTEHKGAKSPYFNMFNLPAPDDAQDWKNFKTLIVNQLMPDQLKTKLDRTNLGFTLSPIIGHPHWKPKYNGAKHEIVRGLNPLNHENDKNTYLKDLIKKVKRARKNYQKVYADIKLHYKWIEKFLLDYCCNNELPKGNRHNIVSKNLAILVAFRKDKDEIIQMYLDAQKSKHNDVITWINGVLAGTYAKLGVNELRSYIIGNNIPFKMDLYQKDYSVDDETVTILQDVQNPYMNVLNLHKKQPFFYDKNGLYWFWNKQEKYWEMKDDTDIMILIDKAFNFIGSSISPSIKNEYLESIKRIGRINIPKEQPIYWIQFKEQIFDVKNNNIFDASPDYFFCNPIPFSPLEKSNTPIIDKLFVDWVGEDNKKVLYEIIAYCTIIDYPIHLIFCLTGSGRNGKSKFINLITRFIGKENCCSTELDSLMTSRFESSKLYKKLACTMGETNFGNMSKTSMLKKLCGQDLISFEFKNKNPFDDINYAKLLICSNSLPVTDDTSDGFFRRWLIIDFPNEFPEGKDILDIIPEKEYNALSKRCIEILPNLIKDGMFTNQGSISDRKKKYIMASNPLTEFLKKCCKETFGGFVRYSELYTAYTYYLNKHKKRVVSKKAFSDSLAREAIDVEKTTKKFGSSEEPKWVSDRWVNNYELLEDWKEICKNYDTYDNYDTNPIQTPYTSSRVKPKSYLSQVSQDVLDKDNSIQKKIQVEEEKVE